MTAMVSVTLAVTPDDIACGIIGDCARCPVARAAELAMPGRSVQVYNTYLLIDGQRVAMPPGMIEWVARFDDGEPVEPATWTMDVPAAEAA